MKRACLKKIIKEEIKKVLKEESRKTSKEEAAWEKDFKAAKSIKRQLLDALSGINNALKAIDSKLSNYNSTGLRSSFLGAIVDNINDKQNASRELNSWFDRK